MSFGQTVKQIRKSRGLTQMQVVDGLFDRSYLSLIESGKLIPPMDKIQALAQRLDVEVNELIPDNRYRDVVELASDLLTEAVETRDSNTFRKSWRTFAKVYELDRMAECVLQWAKATPNAQVIESMRSTMFASQILGKEISDKWELAVQLGNVYFNIGSYKESIWTYKGILNQSPPEEVMRRTLSNLGSAFMMDMQYIEASNAFMELLDDGANDDLFTAKAYFGYGSCCRKLGEHEKALEHTKVAADLFKRLEQTRYINTQHALGSLYLDQKDFDKADFYFQKSWDYYRRVNRLGDEAELIEEFVRREFYKGEYDAANDWCNECLDIGSAVNNQLAGRIFIWKSWIYEMLGDDMASQEALRAAISLLGWSDFDTKMRYIDVNQEIQRNRQPGPSKTRQAGRPST